MNTRPIVAVAASWTAGIAAAGSTAGMYGLTGAAAALMLAAAVLMKRLTLGLAACCLLVYAAGGGWAYWTQQRMDTSLTDLRDSGNEAYPPKTYEAEAEGTIASIVEIDGDSVVFQLRTARVRLEKEPAARIIREKLLVRLRLLTEEEKHIAQQWRRGDYVHAAGELERPAGASNFGGFDYRQYLSDVQHIHWLLRVNGAGSIKAERHAAAYSADAVVGLVDALRSWLGVRFEKLYPKEQAGYMKGLVIGSSGDLNPELYRQFAELGLTHILAISGLHVAVFLYVLNMGLRLMRLTRERTLLLLAISTPAYVLLSGASPSVVRAGIMAVIGLLAARYNRLKDGLHLLAATAMLMLLWNPAYVHDIGFQLSFLVTAGLIIGVAPVRSVMPRWKRAKPLLDLASVTIVAQLVSFPITIYYFNQWNPLSIPSNYVMVPFISFIVMPLGGASLAAEPIWPAAAHWMAYGASVLNEMTFRLVEAVSGLNGWQMIWRKPQAWWVAAWYAAMAAGAAALSGIGAGRRNAAVDNNGSVADAAQTVPLDEGLGPLAAAARRKHIRMLGCAVTAAAVLLVFAWNPAPFDRTAVVSVLDVGQGDAILIRTGSGQHILIDGGGTVSFRKPGEQWRDRTDPYEVGRKMLVPLLKQRGVHSLDLVIATHLDTDHIGGLRAVLDSVPVQRIWWNGTINKSEPALALLHDALDRNVPLIGAKAGMSWSPDDSTRLDVLWPRPEDSGITLADDQNERSVSVLLTVYGRTFLFPGDIGERTEQQLTAGRLSDCYRSERPLSNVVSQSAASTDGRPCLDVLKAGHHGSKGSTSAQWLRYWKPAYTVISAGKGNVYRHPHPDTLARLEAAGSRVWRTDRDGEIRFAVEPGGMMSVGWQARKWYS